MWSLDELVFDIQPGAVVFVHRRAARYSSLPACTTARGESPVGTPSPTLNWSENDP